MTLRVVVIGTGFGARVVAPVWAATEGCDVVDVVSARDADAIEAALRDARPDLVSVHSPPYLHADHVRLAIAADVRAVLCDKPFTPNPESSRALLELGIASGVQHFVNFEFRRDPARAELASLVRHGAIGTVQHVVWTHHSAGSRVPMRPYGWLFDAAAGGGWIGAWASHAIDSLRVVLASELTVEMSAPRIDIADRPDRDGVLHACTAEDGLVALLRAHDGDAPGASVVIDSTFAAAANRAPRLVLLGREGLIELVADERLALRRDDGTSDDRSFTAEPGRDRHRLPMERWAATVRDAIAEGVTPPGVPTFADGLVCDEILAALRAPMS